MKKTGQRKRLRRTLKTVDIDTDRSSGGSGRCPKNPQGTSPLTHLRALPEPVLAGWQEKGAVAPFLLNRIIRVPYVNRLSRHILALCAPVFHGPVDIRFRSRLCGCLFLKIQDCLLAKEDEKLPFTRHVICAFQ